MACCKDKKLIIETEEVEEKSTQNKFKHNLILGGGILITSYLFTKSLGKSFGISAIALGVNFFAESLNRPRDSQ